MTDESVDLIVSDPPYLINYATGHRQDKAHDFCTPIQNDSNPELIQKYVEECYRILKPNCAFYMFCSAKRRISSKQRLKMLILRSKTRLFG